MAGDDIAAMERLEVRSDQDVVRVRQLVRSLAVAVKLSLVDQTKLVTAASELARNTLVYGGGGMVAAGRVENGRRTGIRIVFTDIDMPRGIDGLKLAALIRDRWPPIEIIVTSGHVKLTDLRLPPRSVFFSKPYRQEQVVAQMRKFAN